MTPYVEVLDTDWLINRELVALFGFVDKDVEQFVNDCPMFFGYWSHANDLAIEQFDSFGRGKDSRFSEFIRLGDREFAQLWFE